MVYLIAGGSHTGKTLLAQRLLERCQYPYLSIDHLKMGLIRSGQCPLTPESSNASLTEYLWPIVREMVRTALENRQNLIVEGCYIPFDWAEGFSPAELAQIKYLCLIFSEAYIRRHYEDIKAFACAIERRVDDSYCTQEILLSENRRNLDLCKRYGCRYLLMDEAYTVSTDSIIQSDSERVEEG